MCGVFRKPTLQALGLKYYTGQDLEELYKMVSWPLYKLYGHAFDAFKDMVSDPDAIFQRLVDDVHGGQQIEVLTTAVREAIVKNIRRRMTPQPLKIRADVDLTCFAYDGVLHIQVKHCSRSFWGGCRPTRIPTGSTRWLAAGACGVGRAVLFLILYRIRQGVASCNCKPFSV